MAAACAATLLSPPAPLPPPPPLMPLPSSVYPLHWSEPILGRWRPGSRAVAIEWYDTALASEAALASDASIARPLPPCPYAAADGTRGRLVRQEAGEGSARDASSSFAAAS